MALKEKLIETDHAYLEFDLVCGRAAGHVLIRGASRTEFFQEYGKAHWEAQERMARLVARAMLRKVGAPPKSVKKAEVFFHRDPDVLVLDFRLKDVGHAELRTLVAGLRELADRVRDADEGRKFVQEAFDDIKAKRGRQPCPERTR